MIYTITHTIFKSNLNSYSILKGLFYKPFSTNNTPNNPNFPKIKYPNADIAKIQILEENKNKSGIYRWINLVNQKTYVGSSANLEKRFRGYYSINHLESRLKKAKSNIYSAILKSGYSNFSLEILEYVEWSELILREQYYIDLLKPEYNILPAAGSRKGYKSSPETIEKLKKLAQTPEHLERLKKIYLSAEVQERLKNHNSSAEHLERLLKNSLLKARKVEVLNTISNEINVFNSISDAGRFIGCSEAAVRKALKELKEKNITKLLMKKYVVKPLQDNN